MRILCHIHTFNDEEVIDRCVESVVAQTRPPDQLLIVDNASADSTLERNFPRGTEIIRNAENVGTSGAVGVGLRYAMVHGYDWVWVLDADATPRPEALEQLMALWDRLPTDQQRRVWRMSCLPLEAPEKAINEQSRAVKLLTYTGSNELKPRHGIVFHDYGCHQIDPDRDAHLVHDGEYYEFDYSIWSGCLFRTEAVRQVELPNVDYVLDYGEYEYAYRGKLAGLTGIMSLNSTIVQNITGHATYRFTQYRLLGLRFQLIEMPAFRCYYLCRNLLNFWVFEFRGQRLRAAAPRVLKTLLLTLNFMLRPVSRNPELRACVRGLWDGIWRRMDRRYTVYGRKRAGATR